jgi:hypothetical protein
MAGPLAILIPAGLLLLVGGAAAAGAKKKGQQAAAAGAGAAAGVAPTEGTPSSTTTPSVRPPSTPTVTAPVSVPGGGIAAQPPSDIQAMVLAALQSGNPATMLRIAQAIEATYPDAAKELRSAAIAIENVVATQTGKPTTPTTPTSTPVAPAQSEGGPVAVPARVNVPTPTVPSILPAASMPVPTPQVSQQQSANRARAAMLTLQLKTAKKGTASEPRALVKEFQLVERLPRTDGSYGTETALALADRYGIVPPKPLYFGKKGGDFATYTRDKNAYSTHLLNLAQSDPQRADEWRIAAKV